MSSSVTKPPCRPMSTAIARARDGRRDAVGPGARAVVRERCGQAGHGTRDGDGMIAHVVEKIAQMVAVAVAILFDDHALPHVVRHARAGTSVKGDGLALARLRPVEGERSEAAD